MPCLMFISMVVSYRDKIETFWWVDSDPNLTTPTVYPPDGDPHSLGSRTLILYMEWGPETSSFLQTHP